MSDITLSTNMNLPIPIVGQDPGPDYATNINNSLTLVDQHNHSIGSGVQITPDGLNISSDLSFLNNNATQLRSVRFTSQSVPVSLPTDLLCGYFSGVDFYVNDGNGNQIRITQSGSIAGTSGSITGLVSPATASYVSGSETFVWQSDVNKPANMDLGFAILRNNVANSKGLTLSPPSAMGADYTIVLPALPLVTSSLIIDTSGTISTLAPKAFAISASCGAAATFSGAFSDITNLSVTITTTGRPVKLYIQSDGGSNGQAFGMNSGPTASFRYLKGATPIGEYAFAPSVNGALTVGGMEFLDISVSGSPGTYTYKMQGASSGTGIISFAVLVAYEI